MTNHACKPPEPSYLGPLASAYRSLTAAARWLDGAGAMPSAPVENARDTVALEIANTILVNEEILPGEEVL